MSNFFASMAVGKPSCSSCGLHKTAHTPKMPIIGKGKKGILILAGEPSYAEDRAGMPLAGNSGREFGAMMASNGINMEEDCWRVNAVRCYSDADDALKHVGKCQASIQKMLNECKPKKVFLLGTVAIASYYHAYPEVTKSLPANCGLSFWDADKNCWVFALTSPGVYTDTRDQCMIANSKRDLENAIAHTTDAPIIPVPEVRKLITVAAVLEYLRWLLDTKPKFAFDYETTGLKPQYPGHKAVSVGICTAEGAVSFPLMHRHWDSKDQGRIINMWKKVLADRKIKKIVQAMNMESVWSIVLFGETNGIIWDTQLASHVLDNREGGYYGLKFQAFLRWGVRDYSKSTDAYIRTVKDTKFNRMEHVPIDALLTYNGLDALYTYHIYMAQQNEFVGNELSAYKFFHRGLVLCGEMHMNGMCMDIEYYKKQGAHLQSEIDRLSLVVEHSEEAATFTKQLKRKFSVSKPDDVGDMFFKVMGFKADKFTKTAKKSVDVEALGAIEHPLAQQIVDIRKLAKLKSTYIDGYLREEANHKVYSVFQLHKVVSFRSSSAMPNYQNTPKRDKLAKKAARSGMIPSPGCVICEADFSGAEVAMSAAYHRDKNFIKYLIDPSTDMHRDCAKDLWLLHDLWEIMDSGIAKGIRQNTKGDWTFAEFYGSYWKQCAAAMWKKRDMVILPDGTTLEMHLKNKGIKGEAGFFKHVEAFETKFWGEMFPEYAEWKKQVVRDYLRDGFTETYLGFRFKGYMNAREIANYPVQGNSFHLLLYVGYELMQKMKKAGMKTKLIGQIHDSLISDIPIEEVPQYVAMLEGIMQTLQDVFPWMVVPMKIEMECSYPREQGGSFAELEEINVDETCKVGTYEEVVFVKTKGIGGVELKNSRRLPQGGNLKAA